MLTLRLVLYAIDDFMKKSLLVNIVLEQPGGVEMQAADLVSSGSNLARDLCGMLDLSSLYLSPLYCDPNTICSVLK